MSDLTKQVNSTKMLVFDFSEELNSIAGLDDALSPGQADPLIGIEVFQKLVAIDASVTDKVTAAKIVFVNTNDTDEFEVPLNDDVTRAQVHLIYNTPLEAVDLTVAKFEQNDTRFIYHVNGGTVGNLYKVTIRPVTEKGNTYEKELTVEVIET